MDRAEPMEEAGRALAAAAPPLSRVILFGSHARGEADAGSDVDLLVIESEARGRLAESVRLREASASRLGLPIDLVVMIRESAERRAEVPGMMVHWALREGRVLAES